MTGMLTLFLYQVILGRDDPVAEEIDPDCCYDTWYANRRRRFLGNEGGSECEKHKYTS